MVIVDVVALALGSAVGWLVGSYGVPALRRRRRPPVLELVRVYLAGRDLDVTTLEGLLEGRAAGHYRLRVPKAVRGEGQAVALEGELVLVPVERVAFIQILQAGQT